MNRHRIAGLLAWAGLIVGVGLALATVTAHGLQSGLHPGEAVADESTPFWLINASSALLFCVPGWYLAGKRPEIVFGWLALAAGIGHGLGGLGLEWAVASQIGHHAIPGPAVGLWLAEWGPIVEQPVLMVLYGLFPDGRLPRSRVRWPVIASISVTTLGAVGTMLDSSPASSKAAPTLRELRNPIGFDQSHWPPLPVWFGPAALVMIIVLVVRRRAATGEDRRVLSWIVAIGVPVTLVVPPLVVAFPSGIGPAVGQATTFLEITAFVAAALRHRVLGIEVVLNRALLYAGMTAVVAVVYGLIVGIGGSIGSDRAGAPSFVGALAAALVLAPTRSRIQQVVNRLLYGDRDEPYAVLSKVAARLGAAATAEQLLPGLASATALALRVPYVAVELDRGVETQVIAHGVAGTASTRTPLIHQGRTLGTLVVGLRAGETATRPSEQALVKNLAEQASVAAATVLLTDDLRRSRERIVTAREEERRRLRNDLHDGLGPQLTGIALGLDVVAERCEEIAPEAAASTEVLRIELSEAIDDVRRLVDGLRPPRLDEVGLVGALREVASRSERAGTQVTINAPETLPELPAAVEVAAYRIGAEALNNVVRHAQARSCILTVSVGSDLHLSVQDDGRGIDDMATGVGTTSMRDRAEELGGTCTIEAVRPRGCRVDTHLPLVP